MKKLTLYAATLLAAFAMIACEDPEPTPNENPNQGTEQPKPDDDPDTPNPGTGNIPTGSFDYAKLDATTHPRLLINAADMTELQNTINSNVPVKYFHDAILARCEAILGEGDLTNGLVNKRLTSVAENALERILFLSYGYRATAKADYLAKAEKDLLAVCGWSDWNKDNYIVDVAELTTAVALGYDWLYDALSAEARTAAVAALNAHAPALVTESANSTNAICNSAAGLAAIAAYENNKENAAKLLDAAVAANKKGGFAPYGHAGAYLEGYDVWSHATTYEAMLITALDKIFEADGGLYAASEAFAKSAEWALWMVGPSNKVFNYGNAQEDVEPKLPNWFFARKESNSALLHIENRLYRAQAYGERFSEYRLLPTIFALMDPKQATKIPAAPSSHYWYCDNNGEAADGMAFVAVSAPAEGVNGYYAVKGGSSLGYNNHMDNGSFVYDYNGERFVTDLGAGTEAVYAENAGSGYHDYASSSQRWSSCWAYSNLAHSVPVIAAGTEKLIGNSECVTYLDTTWKDSPWGTNGKNYTRWHLAGMNPNPADKYTTRISDDTKDLERDFQFAAESGLLTVWDKFTVKKDCTYRFQAIIPKGVKVENMRSNIKLTAPGGTQRRIKLVTKNCLLNGETMNVNTSEGTLTLNVFIEPLTGEFEGYHLCGFEGAFSQGDEVKVSVSFPAK